MPFESVRAHFGSIEWAVHRTLHFNLPTHAMAWCVAIGVVGVVPMPELPGQIAGYPMPEGWRHSLDDTTRLGLVGRARDVVTLTATGRTMRELIPHELEDWGRVHVMAKQPGTTMARVSPRASAPLRHLLLHDPMVRHLIAGLASLPGRTGTFPQLALACDAVDRARTSPVFLLPEGATRISDRRGRIPWHLARSSEWRTSTYTQWKSSLRHSGIIANTGLGGTTSRTYRPALDTWALA